MIRPSSSEEFQPDALSKKVLNLQLTFHWLGETDRFCFEQETRTGNVFVLVDAATGKRTTSSEVSGIDLPTRTGSPRADWALSPDGKRAIFKRQDDLWLRELRTAGEQRLTHDGEPNFAYAMDPRTADLRKVLRRRDGSPAPLTGILWSPNGRHVIAVRQDLRSFPDRLLVSEYAPPDKCYTATHVGRCSTAGDLIPPDTQLVSVTLGSLTVKSVDLGPQSLNDYSLLYFLAGVVWWRADGEVCYLMTANRGGSHYKLVEIEIETGRVRTILQEFARYNIRLNPFDYARPNVHVSADGAEVVWYSERSGHGHLYLYDATDGMVKRQLTRGEWVVFDLLRVDEARRVVYFTGSSFTHGDNPYYRYLYRVNLDGGDPQLLTPERADHNFNNLFDAFSLFADRLEQPQAGSSISPSGRYFVDCYSTTEQAPEYVLRRTSGELVTKLLTSDASELVASGWRPPEPVVAKAADGLTDLYGVITLPSSFTPEKKYPVVDLTYPGPQRSWAPRAFVDQIASPYRYQTFADAGFIVVTIDGRGTAYRSREFRDAFLGTEDVFGASDHVAAIKQLGVARPYMDLDRVGIAGASFGGYGSLRAILLYPDFFKVGVSATGPSEWLEMHGQVSVERFFGVPSASNQVRAYYETISNTKLASRLRGRVLLIYGGIDENVPLKHAFVTLDAFIKADKDVDMLIVPDSAHHVFREPYVVRRSVQYLIDHLSAQQASAVNRGE